MSGDLETIPLSRRIGGSKSEIPYLPLLKKEDKTPEAHNTQKRKKSVNSSWQQFEKAAVHTLDSTFQHYAWGPFETVKAQKCEEHHKKDTCFR